MKTDNDAEMARECRDCSAPNTDRYDAMCTVIKYLAFMCADRDFAAHVEAYKVSKYNPPQQGGNDD